VKLASGRFKSLVSALDQPEIVTKDFLARITFHLAEKTAYIWWLNPCAIQFFLRTRKKVYKGCDDSVTIPAENCLFLDYFFKQTAIFAG
jgi:hypothetical protein